MIRIIISLIFSLFCTTAFTQNNKIPIIKACEENKSQLSCSYFKIHNLILDKLNNPGEIKFDTHKEGFIFSSLLRIKSDGKLDETNSVIYSSDITTITNFDDVLGQIPDFVINYNNKGRPTNSYFRNTFYFKFNGKSFETWNNPRAKENDFFLPEKFPIFKGCKSEWNNTKLKDCMAQQIANYLKSSSSLKDLAKKIKLLPGRDYKISAFFKVDSNGEIINIGARAPHKKLEKEVIQLISKLQKLEPGYIAHKAVTVPFSFPIIYKVNY